jgi:hypothetical protein
LYKLGSALLGLTIAAGVGRGEMPLPPAPASSTAEEFETPPDQEPGALLPPIAAGENYHVENPVRSDGLMHRFALDSQFGKFDAYGRIELELRIREVAALTQLAKIPPLEVVAGSVGSGITSQVSTVTDVARRPVATITGIPRGISHLFHGIAAEGKEAVADAKGSPDSVESAAQKRSSVKRGEAAAKHYADRYFGVTAADRRWYKKLGLDRQRAKLSALGLTPAEVDRWQNTLILSPTRQTLLLEAAQGLEGVTGRAELLRHAMGLTSDTEAQVYLRSVGLLMVAHRHEPVSAVLPRVRLPAARLADGRIVVCGAFEAVYWTSDVAVGERGIRESLPEADAAATREIWLEGSVSERARRELEQRGWRIHESVGLAAAN